MVNILRLCLFILLPFNFLYGGEVLWKNRLEGSSSVRPLETGRQLRITDGNYGSIGSFTDVRQHAYVRLGLAERSNSPYFAGDMNILVGVTITPYNNTGTALATVSKTLNVSYSSGAASTTFDSDDYRLQGNVYKFKVVVTSITLNGVSTNTNLPDFLYLEAGISAERYYNFTGTIQVGNIEANIVSYSSDGTETVTRNISQTTQSTDDIEFAWSYVAGAEYYDLEWTWVDNYATSSAFPDLTTAAIEMSESDFAHNCTRIRTSMQSYRIPQIYAKGYIIYRIRPVGRWASKPTLDKYGPWNHDLTEKIHVSDWPYAVRVTAAHENGKNWQYQATYAEEGKKKEVVQYFDGSLRGRQTVTRITSDRRSVVGETVYDNEGRPSIQILPAPQANPAIRYYPDFNTNSQSRAYSHSDFDWETGGACIPAPAATVSGASGAGKYYSAAAHALDEDWQQYVAASSGYPFSQTEYTPDNTGRIRKQGGVGPVHQVGSGHETDYYYLQANQNELNRLFGYKVGNSVHYKKNLVVDPNGQVSISYLDPQGRVIATSMAGDNPENLAGLDSEIDPTFHQRLSADLLNKMDPDAPDGPQDNNIPFSTGRFGMVKDGLKYTSQLGVEKAGTLYDFKYSARFGSYTESCPDGPGVSFNYVYDLKLSVLDDCGEAVFSETVTGLDASMFESASQAFERSYLNQVLSKNAYTIHKEIVVNEASLNAYKSQYLDTVTNPCILSASDFNFPSVTNCYDTDCASCAENLGTLAAFKLAYASSGMNEAEIEAMYEREQAACAELCAPGSFCDVYYGLMLNDISPDGQYGATDGTDPLSVYSASNDLPGNWKSTSIVYLDEFANPAVVAAFHHPDNTYTLLNNGAGVPVSIAPQLLTHVEDFITALQPSWLDALVKFHPEHKLYLYALEICNVPWSNPESAKSFTSGEYDALLGNINTYAKAQTNDIGVNFASGSKIYQADPYFNKDYSVHYINSDIAYRDLKKALLVEAVDNNFRGTGMSLLQYAVKITVFPNDYTIATPVQNTWAACASSFPTQMDAIWMNYKASYLSYKSQVNQLFMDYYGFSQTFDTPGNTPGKYIYNGYIGQSGQSVDFGASFIYNCPGQIASAQSATITSKLLSLLGSSFGNWPTAYAGAAYDSKTTRFTRLDNLHDASLCGAEILAETTALADHAVWESTGLCPLTIDMEHLLDAMGKRDLLTAMTSMAVLPELVPDLFQAIRGAYPAAGSTMQVSGTIDVSGNLVLAFSGTPSCGVTLPRLSASLPWSSYGGTSGWKIFSISRSYPVSASAVSILVKAGATLATAGEYVITYSTSCLGLNDCQADYANNNGASQDCDKETKLEAALLDMLQKLRAANKLNLTSVSLNTLSGFVYNNTMIQHFGNTATWNGSTATITGSEGILSLGISIPSVSPAVQYVSVNLIGGDFHLSYLNASAGTVNRQSGTYAYRYGDKITPLYLNCVCAPDFTTNVTALLNHALGTSTIGDGTNSQVTNLAPYISIANPGIFNFVNSNLNNQHQGRGISFDLDRSGRCNVSLFVSMPDNLTISSVSNVRFPYPTSAPETFLCDVLLSNATTLTAIEGTFGCLEVPVRCESCLPAAQQPVSCNAAYPAYQQAMTTKFGTGLSTEDQLIFTSEYLSSEEVFCDHQYAYISTAYISYINNLTGIEDIRYLGISEFGATRLGYSSTLLSPAVAAYFAYLAGNPSNPLAWNQYVGQIYLPAHPEICPARMPDVVIPETTAQTDPCLLSNSINAVNSQVLYATYLEQMGATFTQAYAEKAMSSLVETFTEAHVGKEYHYTLYYYDRAGNLIQTVPPEGVKRYQYDAQEAPVGTNTPTNAVINAVRTANPSLSGEGTLLAPAPSHTYRTHYSYNSLNQLVFQETPDGGASRFAYDALGRLIASQNADQALGGKFSYTMYDFLGRAVEAGEFTSPAGLLTIDDKGKLVNASTSAPITVNLYNWIENYPYPRTEVTKSLYDGLNGVTSPLASGTVLVADLFGPAYSKGNTRNRITGVIYKATVPASGMADKNVYENATFYDYDVHGNVKHLLQVNCHAGLLSLNQHIKHIEYRYDLVSGNVKEVRYQPGAADQFLHRYHYDADNRITDVVTSGDGIYFEKDAKYFYYAHGPLARVETGDKKVQAQDYAYTITGWLKAVNGEKTDVATMMGRDGKTGTMNSMVPKDVFGYSLHYYSNDYTAANTQMLSYSASNTNMGTDLYNGNIRTMVTAIGTQQDENPFAPHKTNYTYDQLNRIKSMKGYHAATDAVSNYGSSYSYDANGNLSNLVRYAGSTEQMDNLSYTYLPGKNQLDHVADAQLNAGLYSEDIDNTQLSENYKYDKTGRLTRDLSEKISEIKWTVTNKVKEIIYSTVPAKSISFDYDALGNRIAKHVKESGGTTSTYYFLDAQGNAMSIYNRKKEGSVYNNLYLSERNIYGSQRIGMEEVFEQMVMQTIAPVENLVEQRFDAGESSLAGWDYQSACSAPSTQSNASGQLKVSDDCSAQHDLFINTIPGHHYEFSANFDLTDASNFFIVYYEHPDGCGYRLSYRDLPVNTGLFSFAFDATTTCSRISLRNYGTAGEGGVFLVDNIVLKHWVMPSTANSLQSIKQKVGDKRYELSNHLGNVNVVITDRKVPVNTTPTITDQVGITVSGGTITATASGWGNSGGASVETLSQDGYFEWTLGGTTTENRNIMVGLSYTNADALYTSIDYAWYTYTAGINAYVAGALPAGHVMGQYPGLALGDVLKIERRNGNILYFRNNILLYTAVDIHPQTPMLVDFAFVAAGRKIHNLKIRNSNDYEAVVVMKTDYFPFGMTMPGRNYSASSYRYGFQGQEKDDEIKGEGNSVNYSYRMHDPRIGRFFAIDPLAAEYPHNSPYAFSENMVIHMVELEGLEAADHAYNSRMNEYGKGNLTIEQVNATDVRVVLVGAAAAVVGIVVIEYGVVVIGGYALEEVAEYGFEALTGIPVIIDPIDIIEKLGREGIKKLAKEGITTFSKKVSHAGRSFTNIKNYKQWVDDVAQLGAKHANVLWSSGSLRGALEKAGKAISGKWQAHHIIPTELIKKNQTVRDAIDQGFDFNGAANGIALATTKHRGPHENYTQFIEERIAEIQLANPGLSAKGAVEQAVSEGKDYIKKSNGKLN